MCICRNNENIEMVPGTASKAGQFQQCYTNSQGLNLFLNLINNVSTRQDDATGANLIMVQAKLYIPSTPNNSNETHTFMCLGRTGRFGQR